MERDGLIERRPHPQDSRAQCIYLTQRAKGLETPAQEAARPVNAIALGGLSSTERDQLLALMPRAIIALQEHLGKPSISAP